MRPMWRTLACALGAGGLVLGMVTATQSVAAASVDSNATCHGTFASPGEVAGYYRNLTIEGVCNIQDGPVTVLGNLTVAPGASLNGVYGTVHSPLTVNGNLIVEKNGSALLGCDTIYAPLWSGDGTPVSVPEYPCIDDPNPNTPTYSASETIRGNVVVLDADGVVLHTTHVYGNYVENGGGGNTSCDSVPDSIWNEDYGFPYYTGIFDSTVNGNLSVTNLDTCWFGIFRTHVGGSLINTDTVNGDPDGNEIESNVIQGSLVCLKNTPADQWGDADGVPNKVGGLAVGLCGFNVLVPNPAPEAGIPVTPVMVHVSVPLHHHR